MRYNNDNGQVLQSPEAMNKKATRSPRDHRASVYVMCGPKVDAITADANKMSERGS
jgi:hypothetical protein